MKNRVALVTGASSGIGEAIVLSLVKAGVKCIGVSRREARLTALQSKIHQQYGDDKFISVALDLRANDAVSSLLSRFPSHWPQPDILINNAGLALGTAPAQHCDLDDWHTMIDTNITALVDLTHAITPSLRKMPRADIINMSSVAANYPYPGGNVYGATKAFVRQFSLGLRADLLDSNVRVTSVEPGMCETEFSVVRFAGDAEKASKVYEGMNPLSADDIATTIMSILKLPAHVNVNTIEIMPTQQAFGAFAVHRGSVK